MRTFKVEEKDVEIIDITRMEDKVVIYAGAPNLSKAQILEIAGVQETITEIKQSDIVMDADNQYVCTRYVVDISANCSILNLNSSSNKEQSVLKIRDLRIEDNNILLIAA